MFLNRLSGTLLLTFGIALGGAASASVAGGVLAAPSTGLHAGQAKADGLLRVAMQATESQVSAGQVEQTTLGTWKGEWTEDTSGGSGTLTVVITKAQGGELTGTGEAAGGPCSRTFTLTGWYRSSLVELTLDSPASGSDCPATRVSISMRVGRKADKTIAVGHWAFMLGNRTAGKDFGFLELTKQ